MVYSQFRIFQEELQGGFLAFFLTVFGQCAAKVVASLVVNIFGFLVMTRYHQVGFERKLEDLFPTSLPDCSKPSRTAKDIRKTNQLETDFLEKPDKFNDC